MPFRHDITVTINDRPVTVAVDSRTSLADLLRDELRPHRHPPRLRARRLRLLHRAARRRAGPLVHHARRAGRRPPRSPPSRGSGPGRRRSASCRRRSAQPTRLQCGFCTPGMVLAGQALLDAQPRPTPRRHRRGPGRQHLPLHRLRADPGGGDRAAGRYRLRRDAVGSGAGRRRASGACACRAGRIREDRRFVPGRGRYVADITPPGHPARRPGHQPVRARPDHLDRPAGGAGTRRRGRRGDRRGAGQGDRAAAPVPRPARRAVAAARHRVVRYAGEWVAAVVATSRAVAEDAAELVAVDYEPRPAVLDPEAAMRPGSPLVHHDLGTNVWRTASSPGATWTRTSPRRSVAVRTPGALEPQLDGPAGDLRRGRQLGRRPRPARRVGLDPDAAVPRPARARRCGCPPTRCGSISTSTWAAATESSGASSTGCSPRTCPGCCTRRSSSSRTAPRTCTAATSTARTASSTSSWPHRADGDLTSLACRHRRRGRLSRPLAPAAGQAHRRDRRPLPHPLRRATRDRGHHEQDRSGRGAGVRPGTRPTTPSSRRWTRRHARSASTGWRSGGATSSSPTSSPTGSPAAPSTTRATTRPCWTRPSRSRTCPTCSGTGTSCAQRDCWPGLGVATCLEPGGGNAIFENIMNRGNDKTTFPEALPAPGGRRRRGHGGYRHLVGGPEP